MLQTISKKGAILQHQSTIDKVYIHCKKITEILQNNQWFRKRCFIIGGGESLKNFDFNKLRGELVIGINKTFIDYSNIDILYFMDIPFYAAIKSGQYDKFENFKVYDLWKSLKTIKVCLSPFEFYPLDQDIYCVRRLYVPEVSQDLNHGIYPGNNSGFGAISLAVILGCNPIYLLGYDMQCKEKTHYHKGYIDSNIEDMREKVDTYKRQLEQFAHKFLELGINIININTEEGTALRCFPIKTIDEVLNE